MMGRRDRSPTRFALLVLAVSTMAMSGCRDGLRYSAESLCLDGSSPDLLNDDQNCGLCGNVCSEKGLHGQSSCVAGICVVADPRLCDSGFHDVDGIESNGCECQGPSAMECRVCQSYEVLMNDRDDDCNPATPDHGALRRVDIPHTRVHCGARGVSCTLPTGAADVACQLESCTVAEAEAGRCGVCSPNAEDGQVWCGRCVAVDPGSTTAEDLGQCFDGIDNDRNGLIDDGPHCEVLLPNAATPECNQAAPSAECPPNPVTIPSRGGALARLEVELTYDFVIDRHEITRGQYASFLDERGLCVPDERGLRPRHCRVEPTNAMLPVSDVSWCEAYAYCSAVGKRLPTLAEYYRAASADAAQPGDPRDAQGPDHGGSCDGDAVPVTARCGADGPEPVNRRGGDAYVSAGAHDEVYLAARAIRHLTGNVSEWLFDVRIDWCATDGVHTIPELFEIECGGERPHQRRPFIDWAPSPLWLEDDTRLQARHQRMVCGGGWAGPEDAVGFDVQQSAWGGVRAPHYGFRCARTVHPDPILAGGWPYDRAAQSWTRSLCNPLPEAGAPVVAEEPARVLQVVDVCAPAAGADWPVPEAEQLDSAITPMYAVLHGPDDRVEQVSLQLGLQAGTETLWLRDVDPLKGAPAEASCTASFCGELAMTRPGGRIVFPGAFDTLSRGYSVQSMALGGGSTCLAPADDRVRLEIEVAADTDDLRRLFGLPSAEPVPDALLRALDGTCRGWGDDGACDFWWVTLEIGATPLDR